MDRALCSAGLQISTRYLQFSLRSASAAGGRRWRASEKKQRWRSWIQIGVECPTSVLGGRRCLAYGEIQAFPIGLATCKLVQVVRWAFGIGIHDDYSKSRAVWCEWISSIAKYMLAGPCTYSATVVWHLTWRLGLGRIYTDRMAAAQM